MKWETINKFRRFIRLGFFKTIYINFSKLPFNQAIKFPIILTRNTYFYDLSGEIEILGPIKFGMIRFGYFGEDTLVWKDNRILIKIKGKITFKGSSHYGIGAVIRVEKDAELIVGDNVRISNLSKIICYKSIEIGSNSRIAWECQIIDTTFHYIRNIETQVIQTKDQSIRIGNNNWIGNRSSIMKGTFTPDFCIITGNSLCNKKYEFENYCMIGGSPAKLIKTGVYRVLDQEEEEINTKFKN